MAVFPSEEWMRAFCEALASHPDVDEVAAALPGVYRFEIEPSGPHDEAVSYDVAIRSEPTAIELLEVPAAQPTLALRATRERWRQLIEGRLDIGMAVMLRRIKVRGEIGWLTSRLDRTRPLLDALGLVQTEWADR